MRSRVPPSDAADIDPAPNCNAVESLLAPKNENTQLLPLILHNVPLPCRVVAADCTVSSQLNPVDILFGLTAPPMSSADPRYAPAVETKPDAVPNLIST